jgi:hypothetical protein
MNMTSSNLFSRQAWEENAQTYELILTMPFNAELAAGTLSEDRFKHYITQDARYLIGEPRSHRAIRQGGGSRDHRRAGAARFVSPAIRNHS